MTPGDAEQLRQHLRQEAHAEDQHAADADQPEQHQDRAHAAGDRRRIGAQEPEDAEPQGREQCERQEDGSMSGLWVAVVAPGAGRRGPWRRRLLLLLALDLLPARDVAIVLVDVGREDVPALSVGDEVQRAVARRRVGTAARIEARPGLQIGPGGRPATT